MTLRVSEEVYKWMSLLDIHLSEGRFLSPGKCELSAQTSTYLENGVLFAKLAMQLSKNHKNKIVFNRMDDLKDNNNFYARQHNWQILYEAYQKLDYIIDSDLRTQIIQGDHAMVMTVLEEIFKKFNGKQLVLDSLQNDKKKNLKNQLNKNQNNSNVLDISKVDTNKLLARTTSLLEYFIVVTGKHLQLTSKQAASFFTQNNTYLAHVIVKGVKGQFEPIQEWYEDIQANSTHLVTLLQHDKTELKQNLQFTLQALKPGLMSKDFQVAENSANLLTDLAEQFHDVGLGDKALEWFKSENGGLHSCMLGFKRHPELHLPVTMTVLQFSKYQLLETFTSNLKTQFQDELSYLYIASSMIQPISLIEERGIEDFQSLGVFDIWIETAIETIQNPVSKSSDLKIQATNLLVKIWIHYSHTIESNDKRLEIVFSCFKKQLKEHSTLIVVTTIVQLFELYDHMLGDSQHDITIYKILVFCLLEHINNIEIREVLLSNFIQTFKRFDNLSFSTLLDPFFSQIHVQKLQY